MERMGQPGRVLAIVLLVASLITIIGIVISALGAPELGVIDDWGRIDDIGRRVASWEYVLVAVIAVGAALVSRQLGGTRSSEARGSDGLLLGLVLLDLLVLAAAAIGGGLAVLNRTTLQPDGLGPVVDYYTADEQLGEIVVFAGILVAIVAVAVVAIVALRREKSGNLERGSSVVTA